MKKDCLLFSKEATLNDFHVTKSFNKGSKKGSLLIERSLKFLGCARSIVVDKNNNVIAGNKVLAACQKEAKKKVIVVDTTGDELVVVRRNDVTYDCVKGLEIALTDNLLADKNLVYDAALLLNTMGENFGFDPRRWEGHSCLVKELTLEDLLKDGVKTEKKKERDESTPEQMVLSLF